MLMAPFILLTASAAHVACRFAATGQGASARTLGAGRSRDADLELLDVGCAEEELAVQVRLLDGVHVSHVDAPLAPAPQTHHGPILEHLTSGSCAPTRVSMRTAGTGEGVAG